MKYVIFFERESLAKSDSLKSQSEEVGICNFTQFDALSDMWKKESLPEALRNDFTSNVEVYFREYFPEVPEFVEGSLVVTSINKLPNPHHYDEAVTGHSIMIEVEVTDFLD